MLLTWIVTAAAVALFTSMVIIFMNAILTLYDKIVEKIKRRWLAKKAVKIRGDGKVEPATVVLDDNGNVTGYTDVIAEPIDPDEVDDALAEKIRNAKKKNQKYVEVEMSEEVENELRNEH